MVSQRTAIFNIFYLDPILLKADYEHEFYLQSLHYIINTLYPLYHEYSPKIIIFLMNLSVMYTYVLLSFYYG